MPVSDELPQPRNVALLVPNTHTEAIHAILRSGTNKKNTNSRFSGVRPKKKRPRSSLCVMCHGMQGRARREEGVYCCCRWWSTKRGVARFHTREKTCPAKKDAFPPPLLHVLVLVLIFCVKQIALP